MVLCSMTIHGLSIPFFSLGRRVCSVGSRTLSRHTSTADWALHTKHITCGEDVVINRDPVSTMEKGEGAVMDSEGKSTTSGLEDGEPDVIEENLLSPTATLAELPEENKEDLPDGSWNEEKVRIRLLSSVVARDRRLAGFFPYFLSMGLHLYAGRS